MTNILSINELKTVEDLENMLSTFENLKVCPGLTNKGDFKKLNPHLVQINILKLLNVFGMHNALKLQLMN